MSRIEKLVRKMCPDGVEYKQIGSIAEVSIGEFVHKNCQSDKAPYPVYNGGISNTGFYEKYNRTENKIIISARGANAGFVNRVFTKYWSGNSCYSIDVQDKRVNWSYVYYYLKNNELQLVGAQQNGGIPAVSKKQVEEFEIPIPPIEIQQEIVHILDKFIELEAGLQAELVARKKQYQYYLDDFFDSPTKKLQSLSEIGTLQRGKRFVHADAVENDGVACIHYGELYTYYGIYTNYARSRIREELRPKMRYAHKGDVIIVGAGENNVDIGVGVVWDGEEDVAVHDACYTLKHQQNPKYISYYLRSSFYHNQIKRFVSEGKICSISAEGIGRAIIPIPSMEEQNRVVRIFDNFDAISNDKILGLQAEIILRHKQYEYYRDLLLTFERTE